MGIPNCKDKLATTVEQWVAEARESGTQDVYGAKRLHARTTWYVPLIVRVLSGARTGESCYAKGKDVSSFGMAIVVRKDIPAESIIEVSNEAQTEHARARVIHCTPTLGAYIIGVAFDENPAD